MLNIKQSQIIAQKRHFFLTESSKKWRHLLLIPSWGNGPKKVVLCGTRRAATRAAQGAPPARLHRLIYDIDIDL